MNKIISRLKFGFLNVGGLVNKEGNKLEDPLFLNEIQKFDIMFLVETHIGYDLDMPNLGPFHCYTVCRPKSRNNRYYGGLAILCNVHIKPHVKILPNNNSEFQWVKLEREFFGLRRDVYICVVYIPPASSSYSQSIDYDLLESIEKDVRKFGQIGDIMLCGDFNARVSNLDDFIPNDCNTFLPLSNSYCIDGNIQKKCNTANKSR